MNPLILVTYTFKPGGTQYSDVVQFPRPIATHDDLRRLSNLLLPKDTEETIWQIISWTRFEDEK